VHFFDPLKEELLKLKNSNKNLKHYFNSFGLSDEDKKVLFYKKYQSIFNRKDSCRYDDIANEFFYFKKSKNYLIEKNIKKINFLKIDVEGSELDVLKGFEDMTPTESTNNPKPGKKEKVVDGEKKEKGIFKGLFGSLKTWLNDDHDDYKSN
jgi:FkbM family methyltransferase